MDDLISIGASLRPTILDKIENLPVEDRSGILDEANLLPSSSSRVGELKYVAYNVHYETGLGGVIAELSMQVLRLWVRGAEQIALRTANDWPAQSN